MPLQVFLLAIFQLQLSAAFLIDNGCDELKIIRREQWGARAPVSSVNLTNPTLGMVFVHHTDMSDCTTFEQCAQEVRTIQNFHMDERGWDDIGYSFLVGEDGAVYEGRGWFRVGAHTHAFNSVAFGVALLGNFMYRSPQRPALEALRTLLACGVDNGHISSTYCLLGHRDTGQGTLCPGDVLYSIIQNWPHFNLTGPHLHA